MICRYAQIYKKDNGFGYVFCDSWLSCEVIADDMIRLEEDFDLTNKRWNYTTSEWESYEPDELKQEGADLMMTEL